MSPPGSSSPKTCTSPPVVPQRTSSRTSLPQFPLLYPDINPHSGPPSGVPIPSYYCSPKLAPALLSLMKGLCHFSVSFRLTELQMLPLLPLLQVSARNLSAVRFLNVCMHGSGVYTYACMHLCMYACVGMYA